MIRDTQELASNGSRHYWETVQFAGSALILLAAEYRRRASAVVWRCSTVPTIGALHVVV